MSSPVAMRPIGSLRSTAKLLLHTCGNLKSALVTARSTLAAGAPVTVAGLYASGFGLNGKAVVESACLNPVSTPVLPIWLEIQTYAGLPVKTPVPPRTCVIWSEFTSQLNPTRGDQRGDAFGSAPVLYVTALPFLSRKVKLSTATLSYAVLPNFGTSARTPAVTVTFDRGRHSSCT